MMKNIALKICCVIFCILLLSGCAPLFSSHSSLKNYEENGNASWYGARFHKKRTTSGERFNMYALTAAHKTLPLSTQVTVTNLINGRQVTVRINDRGPFIPNRVIDLSYAAAKQLGMIGYGTVPVKITLANA